MRGTPLFKKFSVRTREQEALSLRLISRVLGPLPFPLRPVQVVALSKAKGVEFVKVERNRDLAVVLAATKDGSLIDQEVWS